MFVKQYGAANQAARRAGRVARLAAAFRDPAGLFLLDAGQLQCTGQMDAGWILRRVLHPEAQIEGIDARLADPCLAARARGAAAFVMLLPPAGNLSNPFYSVHPRRNDRFVIAHPPLRRLYPEVDFADFVFTGHLLGVLSALCAARFALLARDIQELWLARLNLHLAQLPDRGVMLYPPLPPGLALPLSARQGLCRPGLRLVPVDATRFAPSVRALSGALTGLSRLALPEAAHRPDRGHGLACA
ncbi:MAG: hypothetical protein JJU19_10255 [Pararhodobacter sp.]|nr:hypothetical protein [Pararhodobacter sp.]